VVEFAVKLLEDDELFNAGKGAVFTSDETNEMGRSPAWCLRYDDDLLVVPFDYSVGLLSRLVMVFVFSVLNCNGYNNRVRHYGGYYTEVWGSFPDYND
jgi:Asparaginase